MRKFIKPDLLLLLRGLTPAVYKSKEDAIIDMANVLNDIFNQIQEAIDYYYDNRETKAWGIINEINQKYNGL